MTLVGIYLNVIASDLDWHDVLEAFVLALLCGFPFLVLVNLIKVGFMLYKAMF